MPTDGETGRALVCIPGGGQDWETEVTIARLRNSGFGQPGLFLASGRSASASFQPGAHGSMPRRAADAPLGTVADENYRLGGGDRLRIRFYDRHDSGDLDGEYVMPERPAAPAQNWRIQRAR